MGVKIHPWSLQFIYMKMGLVLLCLGLFFTIATQTKANIMTNDSYELQPYFLDRVNLRVPNNNQAIQEDIAPQSEEKQSEATAYIIEIGFSYAKNQLPYSVFISSDLLNFGNLIPGEPIIRNALYETNSNSLAGYSILLQENRALSSQNDQFIPDTACDTGTCTEVVPAVWKNPLTYGFGYRCDSLSGTGCLNHFENRENFKRLPSKAENEKMQPTIDTYLIGTNNVYQFTYKVNISPGLVGNEYQNTIKYIILPYY